jgi:hypothetical protein
LKIAEFSVIEARLSREFGSDAKRTNALRCRCGGWYKNFSLAETCARPAEFSPKISACTYQGVLASTNLLPAVVDVEPRVRNFGPPTVNVRPDPTATAREPVRLGVNLSGSVRPFLLGGAAVFASILVVDFGVAKYQEMQVRDGEARLAQLADMALSRLQADIQSVSDLGDGRYELAVYLWNVGSDTPIYVMSPDMHAYVQVGKVWQEVPLAPADSSSSGVLKIDGKQTYRYVFDARVKDFTQLLPNYMHVRDARQPE